MPDSSRLDCVVIGYNELPFDQYESIMRQYGTESEAYRDLRYSFVMVDGTPSTYLGLMNDAWRRTHDGAAGCEPFKSGDIPNLAAVYLTQYLRRRGRRAEFLNLYQFGKEELAGYLRQDPLCVAITTTFYVLNFPVADMVRFIRSVNPRVKIVVGGPLVANHARNCPRPPGVIQLGQPSPAGVRASDELRLSLEDMGADVYVIEAQGEATLAALVGALVDGRPLSDVPNLAYRENGQLWLTAEVQESNGMDENAIDWGTFGAQALGPTIQTRTARSCAFKCAFCNYPSRAGKLSLASLEAVEAELDSLRRLGSVRNIVFIDDTFNVPIGRFKDLCRMMIRNRYGFNWFSYFRCSNADEEAVDLLAESGCAGVFLGIESGAPDVLANMQKAVTIEKYQRGIEWLRARGVLTFGSFIVGFPGETDRTVEETARFIDTTGLDYYRCQLWYCEPGTPIYLERERYGIGGEGFVWRHATMDSLEACDHIDRMFLGIRNCTWLPQWSFDFWIIPYLLGRGLSTGELSAFAQTAHRMLKADIASLTPAARAETHSAAVAALRRQAAAWRIR